MEHKARLEQQRTHQEQQVAWDSLVGQEYVELRKAEAFTLGCDQIGWTALVSPAYLELLETEQAEDVQWGTLAACLAAHSMVSTRLVARRRPCPNLLILAQVDSTSSQRLVTQVVVEEVSRADNQQVADVQEATAEIEVIETALVAVVPSPDIELQGDSTALTVNPEEPKQAGETIIDTAGTQSSGTKPEVRDRPFPCQTSLTFFRVVQDVPLPLSLSSSPLSTSSVLPPLETAELDYSPAVTDLDPSTASNEVQDPQETPVTSPPCEVLVRRSTIL